MSAGPSPCSATMKRRPGSSIVDGIDVRHQPEEERRGARSRLLDVVRLREVVVVERERRVGREELRRVVAERARSRRGTGRSGGSCR